jgi:hypothetical protein
MGSVVGLVDPVAVAGLFPSGSQGVLEGGEVGELGDARSGRGVVDLHAAVAVGLEAPR